MLPTQGYGDGGALATQGYGGGGGSIVDFFETWEHDVAYNDEVDRSVASGIVRNQFMSDQKNIYSPWPDSFCIRRVGNGGCIVQNFIAQRSGLITKVRVPMYRVTTPDYWIEVFAVDPVTHLVKYPHYQPPDVFFVDDNQIPPLGPPAVWLDVPSDNDPETRIPVKAGTEYALVIKSDGPGIRQYLGYDATNTGYAPGKAYEIDRLLRPIYQVEKAWDIPFEIFIDETVHLTERDVALNDQVSKDVNL
jgi:hypothetical protein